MVQERDLDQVKAIARNFLGLDIKETKYSPMIVQHPFTSSGVVGMAQDGDMQLLNILESEANLQLWREYVERQINNARDAYQIVAMLNKPYTMLFLSCAREYLTKEEYSCMLGDAWISAESPNLDSNLPKGKLVNLFRCADPTYLMNEEEREMLEKLESPITVYRGVTPYNAKNIRTLSWSLDYDTADWFAHRFGEDGTVYEAKIDRSDVLALFIRRGEAEVIVNPAHLMDVMVAETPEIGPSLS